MKVLTIITNDSVVNINMGNLNDWGFGWDNRFLSFNTRQQGCVSNYRCKDITSLHKDVVINLCNLITKYIQDLILMHGPAFTKVDFRGNEDEVVAVVVKHRNGSVSYSYTITKSEELKLLRVS